MFSTITQRCAPLSDTHIRRRLGRQRFSVVSDNGQKPLCDAESVVVVTLSSRVHDPKQNVPGNDKPQPTIMVIYGELGSLGFTRFVDLTYHKGRFYAINHVGAIFECNIIDRYTSGATGAE